MNISYNYRIWLILAGFIFLLIEQKQVFAQDQAERELIKKSISNSGCSANLPGNMTEFEVTYSEDSSLVYSAEAEQGPYVYGCIAVKFSEAFEDDDSDELDKLLSSYLNYLEKSFDITSAKGQDNTPRLQGYPGSRGIMDNWEDAEGRHYAVMGWINQTNLAVLYIIKNGDYPPTGLSQAYFNGFMFSR
jgi:hypothetical protein